MFGKQLTGVGRYVFFLWLKIIFVGSCYATTSDAASRTLYSTGKHLAMLLVTIIVSFAIVCDLRWRQFSFCRCCHRRARSGIAGLWLVLIFTRVRPRLCTFDFILDFFINCIYIEDLLAIVFAPDSDLV